MPMANSDKPVYFDVGKRGSWSWSVVDDGHYRCRMKALPGTQSDAPQI